MPTCPHCDATVPEGAVYCGNCGATLNNSVTSSSTQSQTSQTPTNWDTVNAGGMQTRYERAFRRVEMLSYVAAGLGVAILAVLILFYLI